MLFHKTPASRKAVEKKILKIIFKHMKNKKVVSSMDLPSINYA